MNNNNSKGEAVSPTVSAVMSSPASSAPSTASSSVSSSPVPRRRVLKAPRGTRSASQTAAIGESLAHGFEQLKGYEDALREVKNDQLAAARVDKEDQPPVPRNMYPIDPLAPRSMVVQTKTASGYRWWHAPLLGLAVAGAYCALKKVRGRQVGSVALAALAGVTAAACRAIPPILDRHWRTVLPLASITVKPPPSLVSDIKHAAPGQGKSLRGIALSQLDAAAQLLMVQGGVRDYYETALVHVDDLTDDAYDARNLGYDTRLSNLRANPPVQDKVPIYTAEVLQLHTDRRSRFIYSPEMMNQVLLRMFVVPPKDRSVVAVDYATRVTNLKLPGYLAPDVVKGSGVIAVLNASTHDVTSSHAFDSVSFLATTGWHLESLGSVIVSAIVSPLLLALITALASKLSNHFGRMSRVVLSRLPWVWPCQI